MLSAWYDKQSDLVKHVITVLLTVALSQLPPQLLQDLRPEAPALIPAQQAKLDAAADMAETFGWVLEK